MPILDSVPLQAIAGDTLRFTRDFGDYPAPTWDCTFYAENKDQVFSQAAVDDGTSHAFTITAATTADIKPGRYRWRIRATDGTVVETVEAGWIEILVDPAAAGTHDTRSWARRTLDAVEARLEGRASQDQLAMSIAGRSISRFPLAELTKWRDQLRAEVRTEEQAERAGLGRNIKARYVRA